MAEDYELMPHQTIVNIKHELEVLKKKAGSMQEISSKDFKQSIDRLNEKINSLLNLFTEAAKGMQKEESESTSLIDRMDVLEEENRKIAEGILVVADMVKELQKTREPVKMPKPKMIPPPVMPAPVHVQKQMPQPVFRQMPPQQPMPQKVAPRPMPPGPMPQRVAPGPMPRPPMPPQGFPQAPSPLPPLPEHNEKEGFLSKIFKKK